MATSFLPTLALGLGSGAVSAFGAAQQNKANQAMAQRQMDFQERMSSTAYQRATQDMRKAGLNPLLAYSQGGASAPSGSTAGMQNVAQAGVSSALEATKQNLELQLLKAQTAIANNTAAIGSVDARIAKSPIGVFGKLFSVVRDFGPWFYLLMRAVRGL